MTERRHGRGGVGVGVGVDRATRARDVNRPTAEDLAEAEDTLEIVRTDWRPPDKR